MCAGLSPVYYAAGNLRGMVVPVSGSGVEQRECRCARINRVGYYIVNMSMGVLDRHVYIAFVDPLRKTSVKENR